MHILSKYKKTAKKQDNMESSGHHTVSDSGAALYCMDIGLGIQAVQEYPPLQGKLQTSLV